MVKKLDILFALGRPFSPLYGSAMKVREQLYKKGLFRSHTLSVPVISIGNLVLGGTGKTPTVQHIAKLLSDAGKSPAIISRGYGGSARNKINIVSDGKTQQLSADAAGDEPYMLAQSLKHIPVLTGTRRIFPCRHAVNTYGSDILILDDGFQHLAVQRDIDLVLFDATYLAGNSRIFPGGPLREPVSSLSRCHAFIITGILDNNTERAERFRELLKVRYPGKPIFFARHEKAKILHGNGRELENVSGLKCYGFCGIANPARFSESLKRLNIELTGVYHLKDHTTYTQKLIEKLSSLAFADRADCFITTQKDYVKLQNLKLSLPIFILDHGYCIEDSFISYLLEKISEFGR